MSTQNTMDTLRGHLFDVLAGVKSGEIDVDRAKAVCEVSQTIINTAKAESDYARVTGLAVSSSLIEVKSEPAPLAIAAPAKPGAPAEAVTIERRANGAVIERQGHVTRHTVR